MKSPGILTAALALLALLPGCGGDDKSPADARVDVVDMMRIEGPKTTKVPDLRSWEPRPADSGRDSARDSGRGEAKGAQ